MIVFRQDDKLIFSSGDTIIGLTDFYSTNFPLTEFYKRSYIGMFGLTYNLEQ